MYPLAVSSVELSELRLADVVTFLAVLRTGSVTKAAREERVTPSQVSKAIVRLEAYIGRRLLSRRARGVVATEDGEALVPRLQDLLGRARALPKRGVEDARLTVAAPSFLTTTLLPSLASLPGVQLRVLEAGEAFIRAYASDDVFQIALAMGAAPLARAWVSTRLGALRQGFFASPALAQVIGRVTSREALASVPFVMPVYYAGAQFLPGDDSCPIPRGERTAGHETPTIAIALEIAARTRQLAFGPEIAARSLVEQGRLVEVAVRDVSCAMELFLQVNAEHVRSSTHKRMVAALRGALETTSPPSSPASSRTATSVS